MAKDTRAFERLHALVRKGYRAEIGEQAGDDRIVLRHLGKAPDLVLHPDGSIEELQGRVPRHKRKLEVLPRIAADEDADQLRFMKFVEGVSRPRLRDRTRPWRRKYLYIPIGIALFWGLSLLFTAIIMSGM